MSRTKKIAAPDLELEQSFLRIMLVFAYAFYSVVVAYVFSEKSASTYIAISIGFIYGFVSLIIYVDIRRTPGCFVSRRLFAMFLDICATSFAIIYLGEFGAPIFAAYLWVTIGNGFRFGTRYLVTAALLSLIGFLFVAYESQYWRDSYTLIWAGVLILTVVPTYTAVLINRLENEKHKAVIANEEKSRFLANVSHELRTPLNAVIGFSELLDRPDTGISQERLVSGINDSASSLLSLVDDVLDFSRIESGQIDLEENPIEIQGMVESVCAIFSLEAESNRLNLGYVSDPDVPQFMLGDENRIKQVLINLVGNAMKFTEEGGIHVHIALHPSGKRGTQIRFEIHDTGIGISKNDLPQIFGRFKQADDSVRRKYGGTGLGTAISRCVVEAMGGEIGVDSLLSKGSNFWFMLPLKEVAKKHVMQCTPSREDDPLQSLANQDETASHVLVVEDSAINREVFKEQLAMLGMVPVLAGSASRALEMLACEVVDIMILDIQMPGMSGFDFINEYHAITDPATRVPMIVVTGDATEDIKARCVDMGVKAFLAKPVVLDRLRQVLQEVLMHEKAATHPG